MSFDWAKPGARCVCIDDNWTGAPGSTLVRFPMINEVLTVSKVADIVRLSNGIGLKFEEIPLGWFDASHFRPLVIRSQEHDIALFLPLLNTRELVK